MPVIGQRCHELRIQDRDVAWRVIYRVDEDAVIIADVFAKKTQATPQHVIDVCQRRLRQFDEAAKERS
jgi:phage-related protein